MRFNIKQRRVQWVMQRKSRKKMWVKKKYVPRRIKY